MPKRGSMKIGGQFVSLGEMPSSIPGVSVADLLFVRRATNAHALSAAADPLDKPRLAYWNSLSLEEVKWGARLNKVRIESKKKMALKLALNLHLPEDPASAPLPSTLVELKDQTGKVISPKGEPIATEKKKKQKRMRPY